MLGHWIFDKSPRNYGSSGYGTSLYSKENEYVWPNTRLTGFCYQFRAENLSGQLLNHSDFSFGLLGLKNGKQLIYAKNGPRFYKPDDKFASNSGEWMVQYIKEDFADKEYTISFWKNGQTIYKIGAENLDLNGDIVFNRKLGEIKLFDNSPASELFSSPSVLFGSSSGSIGSGFPLILGGPIFSHGTGINLSLGGFYTIADCYLLDEFGNTLLDESGNPLLQEAPCSGAGGAYFAGFDMYISGQAIAASSIPLYLHNTSTTYNLSSGIPLYLGNSDYILTKAIDLTVYSTYISVGSGVNLYIDNADGLNDGYTPISSGIPLFIQRNENTYFDMYISGGYTTVSGDMNLYLNANTYPVSGSMNLAMSGKDYATNVMHLYSAGY